MAAKSGILYQDQFEVKEVSKKFEKVSRLSCRLSEEGYEMALDVDINSDLMHLDINERFTLALASTLDLQGKEDSGVFDQSGAANLLDQYDYAMHGKIFKWKQDQARSPGPRGRPRAPRRTPARGRLHARLVASQPKSPVELHVSFGGLLMRLKGDPRHLAKLALDARIYLLMRKINTAR